MNYLNDSITLVEDGNLSSSHNLSDDIMRHGQNTEMYTFQRTQYNKDINDKNFSYKIFLNNDRPRYIVCIYVGQIQVKKFADIDSNSLLSTLKYYGIPLTEKTKIIM